MPTPRDGRRAASAVRAAGLCVVLAVPTLTLGAPPCDPICEPDPGSTSFQESAAARTLPRNARGRRSVLGAMFPDPTPVPRTGRPDDPFAGPPGARVVGSESFARAFPILRLPGRAGLDVALTLHYSSRVWSIDPEHGRATFNADRDLPSYGFRLDYGYLEGPFGNERSGMTAQLVEPDGTKRELVRISFMETIYRAYDSSRITVDLDPDANEAVLWRPDGTRWRYERIAGEEPGESTTLYRPVEIRDTNGNLLTLRYRAPTGIAARRLATVTDTVGREITFVYDTEDRLVAIEAPGVGGGRRTVAAFTWDTVPLDYAFDPAALEVPEDTPPSGTEIDVLTGITWPNGTTTTFAYGAWGIVAQIERRSSAGVLWSCERFDYPDAGTPLAGHPTSTEHRVSMELDADGRCSGGSVTTYATTKGATGAVGDTTVTDPTGTVTRTTLFTEGDEAGLTRSVALFAADGTPLRSVHYAWATGAGSNDPVLTRLDTVLEETGQTSRVTYGYDTHGNVTAVTEYDYDALTTPVRRTEIDYLSTSAYVDAHILDRPVEIRVYGADGTLAALTRHRYDDYSDAPLLDRDPVPLQHDSTFAASFTLRGNLTHVTRYDDAAAEAGPVVHSLHYDVVGNVVRAELDCCSERRWIYTATTDYAYPETTTTGPPGTELTERIGYDLGTGIVVSTTDANLQETTFAYDAALRPTATTLPDGTVLLTLYDDVAAEPTVTTITPIDPLANTSRADRTTRDGLGRVVRRELLDGLGTDVVSAVAYEHDPLGRVVRASHPYDPDEGGPTLWTTTEVDALGRITKLIPPDATPLAGFTAYTYDGNRTTLTDPAGRERRTTTDALGRLVQVDEPGYPDAAAATGSVRITGARAERYCAPLDVRVYDEGTVTVEVTTPAGEAIAASAFYDRWTNVTAAEIAAALAAELDGRGSPVTAVAAGDTVTLTARDYGAHTSLYALAAAAASTFGDNETCGFVRPLSSYAVEPSGPTLTGGSEGGTGTPDLARPRTTRYDYDAADRVVRVLQGQQARTFDYDSLQARSERDPLLRSRIYRRSQAVLTPPCSP